MVFTRMELAAGRKQRFSDLLFSSLVVSVLLTLCPMQSAQAWASSPASELEGLPALGRIPDFSLQNEAGKVFEAKQLEGNIWIANFIFTRCTGPCPLLSRKMAELQKALLDEEDVRLLSFTVDPDYDSPEVLQEYARIQGAKSGKWSFLTGPVGDIQSVVTEGFKIGLDKTGDAELTHGTHFVLLDTQRQIRGFYRAREPGDFEALLRDARRLAHPGETTSDWSLYLPTLNASLNGICTILLLVGWFLVRGGYVRAHRSVMLAAFATSSLFLTSYLIYHYLHGSKPFPRQGWIRPVYFGILISHILLAIALVPLVLATLYRGLKGQFDKHRRIARWTFPIWLYVSITGVVVYWMLYRL